MTDIIKLNLARNCIKYIIRAYGINEIHIPYYTCPVVWQSIREENCKIKFYNIDKNFMPIQDFKSDDFIIYTNYFGLCTDNCERLSIKYNNLIIDNSQAFFAPHMGLASFNSLRKFFKVQNGAYLRINKKIETEFKTDSLELTPTFIQENYDKFVHNELLLNNQKEIKTISPLVEKEIHNINFEKEKDFRLELFNKYNLKFGTDNKIQLTPNENKIPYCYPFCPKTPKFTDKFIKNNLILLRLWQPISKNLPEFEYLNETIALPLTQDDYPKLILDL